jgi:putative membrane protein
LLLIWWIRHGAIEEMPNGRRARGKSAVGTIPECAVSPKLRARAAGWEREDSAHSKHMKIACLAALTILTVSTFSAALAQESMIGGMSMQEFDAMNKKGAAAVAAVKATSTPLSATDKALLMKLGAGGMMQLEVSRVAAEKATRPDVKAFAVAEVAEQTGLAAKLKEIASAKGIEMPSSDPKAEAMAAKLNKLSGDKLDAMYVQQGGVKGHEALKATAAQITSEATDMSLKEVATAATPLVLVHLKVAKAEAKMP